MPGFNEYSNHFSDFDMPISLSARERRYYSERAAKYLLSLNIKYIWLVKNVVRGYRMKFKFNANTSEGMKSVTRIVDLDTYEFIDKIDKTCRKHNLLWDGNNFVVLNMKG